MAYFPFMIEVKGHKALVVGAGRSAAGKIRDLTDFGAKVTVVAPVISADVVKQGKNITIERRVYRPGETKGYEIVVAATDNTAVNKQVAHDAARFGAICTVAGDPSRGGFVFPSIIRTDRYSVAVSADGKDKELEERIKEMVKEHLPVKVDEINALIMNAKKEAHADEAEEGAAQETDGLKRRRLADMAGISQEEETVLHEETPEESVMAVTDEEGSVIKVGALDERYDQILADGVISALTAGGHKCEKAALRPGEEEKALLAGDVDLVVRQGMYLPVELPDQIEIAACLPRDDARDILVTKKGTDKNDIDVIGTSSEAKKAQIERFMSLGEVISIGGSCQDRIELLKRGEYDAIILTAGEVKKLMLVMDSELSFEFIEADKSLPEAGQGITVLETRSTGNAHDAAFALNDKSAMESLTAEREFLKTIGAEKNDEAAAYSMIDGGRIMMKVMRPIAGRCVYFAGTSDEGDGEALGRSLGEKINKSENNI